MLTYRTLLSRHFFPWQHRYVFFTFLYIQISFCTWVFKCRWNKYYQFLFTGSCELFCIFGMLTHESLFFLGWWLCVLSYLLWLLITLLIFFGVLAYVCSMYIHVVWDTKVNILYVWSRIVVSRFDTNGYLLPSHTPSPDSLYSLENPYYLDKTWNWRYHKTTYLCKQFEWVNLWYLNEPFNKEDKTHL